MIPDELRIVAGAAIAGVTAVAGGASTRYLFAWDEKAREDKKIETIITETTSTVDGQIYITKTSDNEYITTFTEEKYVTKSTTGGIEYITLTGGDRNITKTIINGEEHEYVTYTIDVTEYTTYIIKPASGKRYYIITTSNADYETKYVESALSSLVVQTKRNMHDDFV